MSPNGPARSRRELLINGRRVRISDLIDADLLKSDDVLFYQQRIGETPHRAVVTERGRLRLADRREFSTPSAAAAAVAEVSAVHGWAVWRLGADGPTLHQLRQRLLKSVAEEVASDRETPGLEAEAVRRRFAILEEARLKAEAGQPETLTVREFIRMWGLADRDRTANAQIDADLANHGLTTVPDFRAVSLDRTIQMIVQSDRDGNCSVVELAAGEPEVTAADVNEESVDIGLTLGNLLSDDNPLVSVSPSATFEEAATAMQINNYSQVAVLANAYTLHGAVSWKSIAEAKHRNPDASFSDAIDRRARNRVFDYDTRLLDVLRTLQQDEFIFVRDFERKITGIVTAADVVHKYDETATPFFLIGEIDQELRHLLQNTFDEETIRQACRSAGLTFKSVDSMSIGQYQAVLDNPNCWAQLGWPLDRKLFIARLNELRMVRNNVMHFNPDPVKISEAEKLRNFLNLIRRYSR
jgi:predicted transcriptional regulator